MPLTDAIKNAAPRERRKMMQFRSDHLDGLRKGAKVVAIRVGCMNALNTAIVCALLVFLAETAQAQGITDTTTVGTWLDNPDSPDTGSTTRSLMRLVWFYGWRDGYLSAVENTETGRDYEQCVRRIELPAARETLGSLLQAQKIGRRTLISKAMKDVAISRCGEIGNERQPPA
jgi:hypothetical protein